MNRYETQLNLRNFDQKAQEKLLNSRILLVGAGGLGAACLPYLVGAGVGHITIIDPDQIELSNLHRQVIYSENEVGQSKAETAAHKLATLNSDVEIKTICAWLGACEADELVGQYDLVLDGSDNYNAKFALNDACIKHDVALLSASISGLFGNIGFYAKSGMPSYRAMVNEPQIDGLNCSDQGVLGSVSGTFGVLMAHEAIKYLSGFEAHLNQILMLDLLDYDMRKISLPTNFQSEFKPFDFKDKVDANILVDVRSDEEYGAGHLNDSHHFPIDDFDLNITVFEGKFEKSDEITLYCKSGKRAFNVAVKLQKLGFANLFLSKQNFSGTS